MITRCKRLGLVEVVCEFDHDTSWQRCTGRFYRNVLKDVPRGKSWDLAATLKAVDAKDDVATSREQPEVVTEKIWSMRLSDAGKCFEDGVNYMLYYLAFHRES